MLREKVQRRPMISALVVRASLKESSIHSKIERRWDQVHSWIGAQISVRVEERTLWEGEIVEIEEIICPRLDDCPWVTCFEIAARSSGGKERHFGLFHLTSAKQYGGLANA